MKFLTAQSTVSAVVVLSFGVVLTLLLFVAVPAGSTPVRQPH